MLTPFISQKFRFWAFISMVLLVFVHGYNLNQGYLQPWTMPGEPLTVTGFTEYWLANGIFRFRIPMLFIISGYLFALGDAKPYTERSSRRIKTLLYPYLTWSAFGLLLTYALELFPYGKNIVAATHMMQIDETRQWLHQYQWYEVLARWIFFPVSYQLWFIRVLLIYNLAYPILKWILINKMAARIFFIVALLLWIATAGFIIVEGEGLLFFSLGIWMQKTNFNVIQPGKWLNPKLWFIIFISLSIIKTWLAFNAHFKGIIPILLIMHKIVVASGLICAWYGCDKLVKFCMNRRWFQWLTAFSFFIYVLHAPLIVYATKAVFLQFNNWPVYRAITFILLPSLLVVLSILKGAFLRRFFPAIYSFLTGSRGLK
jgi:fucose 4-O-acetylase-like acetyltransferase